MRFIVLLAAMPLVLLLVWQLSLFQTLESYRQITEIRNLSSKYPEPEQTLQKLTRELAELQQKDPVDVHSVDEQLMQAISSKSGPYRISLEAFPETHTYRGENYTVQTFRIRFSGKFMNLLRFVHYSEYRIASCRLVSVDFQRENKRKTGEKLYADLYFQTLFKNK